MKVAELLEKRRKHWLELENLCDELRHRRKRKISAATISRFSLLYRDACADLALADSAQLPPNTVQYLHKLVARAHNQLYRSRAFEFSTWGDKLLVQAPQQIFNDRCVQVAFFLFWSIFILSAVLAATPEYFPRYAETILTPQGLDNLETMYENELKGRTLQENQMMAAYYILHNTTIGLKGFAYGILVIPGLGVLLSNAATLGAAFGYMSRPDVESGKNFFEFVTAHGPFELTAIVLASGAGLRLGMSLLSSGGLTRVDSLRKAATEGMPVMGAAMAMFFLAALVEGFISPSSLPYGFKVTVAILSSGMLTFYFLFLGYPRRPDSAVG